MLNPFIYSDSNKRYQTFDYYLKNHYGFKAFKVSLDASFTCPNRDGSKGIGGCIFCSSMGSGEYAGSRKDSLMDQFKKGTEKMQEKWPDGKPIAYFQNYTNTYGNLSKLKDCFEQFVELEDCVAIAIATRPDCLNDEIIEYLDSINKRKELFIELGLQTIYDETGKIINRCCDYKDFANAVSKLSIHNIKVVVHIINGLPNETKEMMINTVKQISLLPIFGVKFHCLNVLKNTLLANMIDSLNLHILTKEEYLDIVSEQISYIPKNVVIERLNSDAKRSDLIAPLWNDKKVTVFNDLDKIMESKGLYQGKNYYNIPDYLNYAHLLSSYNDSFNVAVDATLGNGHDSLFLVHKYKKVYGFDIQDLAIKRSKQKLDIYENMSIVKDSYENIKNYVKEPIDLIMYNLGFLPGSDHKIKTDYMSTINSLKNNLPLLSKNGKCIVVSYTIHDNGTEFNAIKEFLENQNLYSFILTEFTNQKVFEIYKK